MNDGERMDVGGRVSPATAPSLRTPARQAQTRAIGAPRQVGVVWMLLMVNVLQVHDVPTMILPISQTVFQVIAKAPWFWPRSSAATQPPT